MCLLGCGSEVRLVLLSHGLRCLAFADGSAVLIDSLQAGQTISIKTIEVMAHSSQLMGLRNESVRWVQNAEGAPFLARFPGNCGGLDQCPHHGCCEFCPFSAWLGVIGVKLANMTSVWDMWAMDDGPGEGGCSQMASTAMCGQFQIRIHIRSVSVWGSVAKQRVDARPGSRFQLFQLLKRVCPEVVVT